MTRKLNIDSPLTAIKGIGPNRQKLLAKLGLQTVRDLLYFFPRGYLSRGEVVSIHELDNGCVQTVAAKVVAPPVVHRLRRGLSIVKLQICDETGQAEVVWFNQPYIKQKLIAGKKYFFSGKIKKNSYEAQLISPEVIPAEKGNPLRIKAVYPLTEGISQAVITKLLQTAVNTIIDQTEEIFPDEFLRQKGLLDIQQALRKIHFPESEKDIKAARQRLVFEELFMLQLKMKLLKQRRALTHRGIKFMPAKGIQEFINTFPFKLTKAQERVIKEVFNDMMSYVSMNRLIQGDVGSGKTVIAACALFLCVKNGYQGAFMVPTEILAHQQYITLKHLFRDIKVNVGFLSGNMQISEKQKVLADIQKGNINIIVGTHALIQEGVSFKNLALVITDEQHRFGVKQRAALEQKGLNPDVIVMSATPIPRTLAMTAYGDMDISIIDEKPAGRKQVRTYLVGADMRRRVYNFLAKNVDEGCLGYIVCPLIENPEKSEVMSAQQLYEDLSKNTAFKSKVGLLHGELSRGEKELIISKFIQKQLAVLISTTVIEVGINVPDATIMIIENAERFGLAQLHQLRGRVGRGDKQAYCILIAGNEKDEIKKRLKILTESNDGFYIAEKDLEYRGPGEILGTQQHGFCALKIADMLKDADIFADVQNEVDAVLKDRSKMDSFKQLVNKIQNQIKEFGEISIFT